MSKISYINKSLSPVGITSYAVVYHALIAANLVHRSKSTPRSFGTMAKSLPQGWSNKKLYLDTESFPNEDYHLPPGKVILFNKELSTYLVECDGDFYLWNDLSDGIDKIQEPGKLEDFYEKLSDLENLKTTNVPFPRVSL